MNSEFLEKSLFTYGQASLLNTEEYGYINLNCSNSGDINIYDLPTKIHCYSNMFNVEKLVYHGLKNEVLNKDMAILVRNNKYNFPTSPTLELYAYRLYQCQRAIDVNINAQKTPVMVLCDENSRLTMLNLYKKYGFETLGFRKKYYNNQFDAYIMTKYFNKDMK